MRLSAGSGRTGAGNAYCMNFTERVYGALDEKPRSLEEIAYRVGVLTTIEGFPKEKKIEELLLVRRALNKLLERKDVKSGFVGSHVGWWTV